MKMETEWTDLLEKYRKVAVNFNETWVLLSFSIFVYEMFFLFSFSSSNNESQLSWTEINKVLQWDEKDLLENSR